MNWEIFSMLLMMATLILNIIALRLIRKAHRLIEMDSFERSSARALDTDSR